MQHADWRKPAVVEAGKIRTFSEVVYCQLTLRVVREVSQCYFRHAFPYHQVHHDEGLKDYGPRRVAESVLKDSEHFANTVFASMGGDEDMLDIL